MDNLATEAELSVGDEKANEVKKLNTAAWPLFTRVCAQSGHGIAIIEHWDLSKTLKIRLGKLMHSGKRRLLLKGKREEQSYSPVSC